MRHIVSCVDTYNHKLAQYLAPLLSTHIPSNFATKDSFNFIEEIKQHNIYGKFLISFDVTSLFTNIPLEETINFAIHTIFENYPHINSLEKNFKRYLKEQHLKHILFLTMKYMIK